MDDAEKDRLFQEYATFLNEASVERRAFDMLCDEIYRSTRNRFSKNVRSAINASEDGIDVEMAVWHYTHQNKT